jgi:hypothetical protein
MAVVGDTARQRHAPEDNPYWTSFKFRPRRVGRMSRAGREKFVASQL